MHVKFIPDLLHMDFQKLFILPYSHAFMRSVFIFMGGVGSKSQVVMDGRGCRGGSKEYVDRQPETSASAEVQHNKVAAKSHVAKSGNAAQQQGSGING
jgi:hypothetical protein